MGILDAPPIRRTPTGYTIAALGDSITASDKGTYTPGNSYLNYATLISGGRLLSVGNHGVAGERADQMLSRVGTALAKRPRFLVVLGGTNDINQGVTAGNTTAQITTATAASLRAIYAAARATGAIPVACTVPPYGYASGLSDPRKIANESVNEWIRREAALNDYPLVDFYATLVDPGSFDGSSASAPGNWKYPATDYTSDGTHPTNKGAGIMGQLLYATLSPYLPATPFTRPILSVTDSTQALYLARNPMWKDHSSNPGVFPDASNTFGAAITNSLGVTYSVVTEPGTPGHALNIGLSATATSAGGIAAQMAAGSTAAAGDIVQVCGYFSTDGNTGVLVQFTVGGTAYNIVNIGTRTAISNGMYFAEIPAPASGAVAIALLTGSQLGSTAANVRFWHPKVVNLTSRFGVTSALTSA